MDAQSVDPLGIGEVDDVETATWKYATRVRSTLFFSTLAISLAIAIFFGVVIWLSFQADATYGVQFNPKTLLLVIFPLCVPMIQLAYFRSKVQNEFLKQMAAAIGFTYVGFDRGPGPEGAAFSIGHSQHTSDVMTGTYRTYPARLYNFFYTIGSGKSQETIYQTVFELTAPAPLPHVILNLGKEESVPSDVEPVELEGDFNSYFKLYVSRGAQMEIRELFQPDTMMSFIGQFKYYRMEISGTRVYLIRQGSMTGNRQEFLNICKTMDSVFDTLIPSLKTVSADTLAATAVEQK